jgi:acetyl esterase/lipase
LIIPKIAHWLPQGWLVVSINYRLWPEAGPLEQARDLARALAHVQRHAADWGGDGSRVVLVGHSTGAHLAALVAVDPGLIADAGAAPVRGQVLLDSAALDVVALMAAAPLPLHERVFGVDPAAWPALSPRHRLRGVPAPTLLVYSLTRDDSSSQAQAFAEVLHAAGGRAEVFGSPLPHAEIGRRLGLPIRLTRVVDAFLDSLVAA